MAVRFTLPVPFTGACDAEPPRAGASLASVRATGAPRRERDPGSLATAFVEVFVLPSGVAGTGDNPTPLIAVEAIWLNCP